MQALIFFGEVLLFMNWAPVGDMVLVSQSYESIPAVSKLVRLSDVTNVLHSQTNVDRTVKLDHVSSQIINIAHVRWGRGRTCFVSQLFVWDS